MEGRAVDAGAVDARAERRRRIHELALALLAQQHDLELLDGDSGGGLAASAATAGGWLERNRRLVQRYQALVHTAVTLHALIDQELGPGPAGSGTGL